MSTPIVLADELTAAGYRLAGARTIVPSGRLADADFDAACNDCELLLLSAALAVELTAAKLHWALTAAKPLVLIIPDALRRRDPPDLRRELERTLGVGA
jgi:vacuolar-type H+-ATPase subunit F/Vma7